MPEKQPVEPSLISRITGAFKVLTGQAPYDNAWFGPLTPPLPQVPVAQQAGVIGRAFDFPSGYNTRLRPRSNEAVTFAQMRALADNCDVLRLVMETRKDHISKMLFSISPIDDKKPHDKRCEEVEEFFKCPDGESTWAEWLRMLMEEMMVTDALTIYPWLNNDGTPFRFELVDGGTIKRVINNRGRTPAAPNVAYQQILKGIVTVDYTADELIYMPRNKRVHKVYGYSPVEQIILTINIAIRRQIHQLQYYTEGDKPDLIFTAPPTWSMTQIKEFNDWWSDLLSGNTAARRKSVAIPNGVAPYNTKTDILKDEYDEWLARIVCYAFGVSPQGFIKTNNRATAETAKGMAVEEGLMPTMGYVKSVMDLIIRKYFKYTDLEFKWQDRDATNPIDQNKMDDVNLRNGSTTINEVRAVRGDAPVEGGDVAMCMTATGYVPIIPAEPEPEPEPIGMQTTHDAQGNPLPPQPAAGPAVKPAAKVKDSKKPVTTETAKVVGVPTTRAILKVQKLVPRINRNTPQRQKAEATFAKVVHTGLQKQAKSLVGLLVSKVEKGTSFDLDSGDWKGWDEFDGLFGRQIAIAGKQGVTDAYAQLDLDDPDMLKLANQDAIEYSKERAAELIGKRINADGELVDNPNSEYNIEDSTREMIRGDVTAAMEQGLSNDELAKLLEENYAFSELRAETIARTETAIADVQGNMVVYKQSGVVSKKQWLVGADCCDECAQLADEIVDLDEPFSDGSDGPPAHPSCRCDMLPVLDDTENEDENNATS